MMLISSAGTTHPNEVTAFDIIYLVYLMILLIVILHIVRSVHHIAAGCTSLSAFEGFYGNKQNTVHQIK